MVEEGGLWEYGKCFVPADEIYDRCRVEPPKDSLDGNIFNSNKLDLGVVGPEVGSDLHNLVVSHSVYNYYVFR